MSAGSITLGGNMSVALGPLGRNGEASGSLNTSGKVAATYAPAVCIVSLATNTVQTTGIVIQRQRDSSEEFLSRALSW